MARPLHFQTNASILVNLARIRRATQQTLAHFDPGGTAPARTDASS
ncbi:hypothetical protein LJ655_11970 [Paraburkholderia sp. MMS20-SJTN17]|uniref:Uncharacterized protein n=1 Tax=Paraburkholderia translucens TaxID=2886945 RepID=A0ABS8KD03_9BURK|nr:hypothetical protein [Paraburkholderia sp. MMS20-SJTN17]MCC8402598.1 hypothetical protein [Paraburkholderia sp. MMS20-SJTN17]